MAEVKIEVVDDGKEELKKSTALVAKQVEGLTIKDQADYDAAKAFGKIINSTIKDIKDYFKPIKTSTKEAHTRAVAMEKDLLKKPEELKSKLKTLLLDFEAEQEKIRLAKEKEIQDRLKDKAEAELEKNMEAGIAQADAISDMLAPEDVHVAPTFKKTGKTRHNYKGEVVDFPEFLMAVVQRGRLDLLQVSQSALNEFAKQLGENAKFPGVRFYDEPSMRF